MPAPAFKLGYPEQTPRLPFTAAIEPAKFEDRYAPTALSEVLGQPEVIGRLSTWLEAPYPVAWLLHGPTGTGKSTVAELIAGEFGLSEDSINHHRIKSGTQDGDALDDLARTFRYTPFGGGWRVVIVEEADAMTPKASQLWLTMLDDLPAFTVIVFTTNHPEKFSDRFRHRCRPLAFTGDADAVRFDANARIRSVWERETGSAHDAPKLDDLPNAIDPNGLVSFRNVLGTLEAMISTRRRTTAKPSSMPVMPVLAIERRRIPPPSPPDRLRSPQATASPAASWPSESSRIGPT